MLDGRKIANATPDLQGQIREMPGDCLHNLAVHGLTGESAVQINQVQAPATGIEPALRRGDGIVGKHGAVLHVTLAQAHALTVFQIDSWNDQHVPFQFMKLRNSVRPARWLFSG